VECILVVLFRSQSVLTEHCHLTWTGSSTMMRLYLQSAVDATWATFTTRHIAMSSNTSVIQMHEVYLGCVFLERNVC
jgi:hypothetical protein